MKKFFRWDLLLKTLSYIAVAAVASAATLILFVDAPASSKLDQLQDLISDKFIGESDRIVMEDAAAAAIVDSLGDRWSYYIPASQYQTYQEQMSNSYVGIGITIVQAADGSGFEVRKVEPNGGAREAGILPGDIITAVEGQSAKNMETATAQALIRGSENSSVKITVLRSGRERELTVARRTVQLQVASGQMLEGKIGLVTIENFDSRCAKETIAAIRALTEQGAKGLIFDVRFNPGGYKSELVSLLDHLLPEGELFRSQFYDGSQEVDTSDSVCLELPMAVLINGDSYSAAEFFAAALSEYDWAVTVGEPTVGKGYFQSAYPLSDGSAVNLSVGKYFTPKGVSLADVGGLVPDITVEVDDTTAANIYADLLPVQEDPQIQAALDALLQEIS